MIVVTFCPRCGDRVPGVPYNYTGGPLDASVTYVQTTPDRYDLMARLSGKDIGGMPAYLRVDHDHGEVIVPVQDAAPLVIEPPPSSDLVVVASGASILGTLLLVIGVRGLRRRRRHVPRL